jgi:ankyrin repeat protein
MPTESAPNNHFNQHYLISNLNGIFREKFPNTDIQFNTEGICRAISLCYAHQLFFNQDKGASFLNMLQALGQPESEGQKSATTYLDNLYKKIEELKELLKATSITDEHYSQLQETLREKHEQLAFIENFFLLHANDPSDLNSLFLFNVHDEFYKITGLQDYAHAFFLISSDTQLESFFNPKNSLSPFAQNGIYELNTYSHSMLVKIEAGVLAIFDPNQGWLNEKEVKSFFKAKDKNNGFLKLNKNTYFLEVHALTPLDTQNNLDHRSITEEQKTAVIEKIKSVQEQLKQDTLSQLNNIKNLEIKDGQTPLHVATTYHKIDLVNLLLNFDNIKLNHKDKNGHTPISLAAKMGYMNIVRSLIDAGAHINLADKNGYTPLSLAAQMGHVDIVRALLENGAKVNHYEGQPPLYCAAKMGHVDIVRALLDAGARVDHSNTSQDTPVARAAANGHIEIVRIFLAKGVQVVNTYEKNTLAGAAKNGHIEIVRALLTAGANINHDREPPLSCAAENGHIEIVRALLTAGANVNHDREPPLSCAAKNGHLEIVRELLTAGANVNFPCPYGGTALYWAATNGHIEIVRALLTAGANVNYDRESPLAYAAKNGHIEIVRALLTAGANVNYDRESPLSYAAKNGHLDIVRELLTAGANVNLSCQYEGTPLFCAAQNGHIEIVRELLTAGANNNLEHKDEYGNTPLSCAAQNGHIEIVRELLEAGARVNLANNDGETPLDSAAYYGHIEIVKLLLGAGADVNLADSKGRTPLFMAAQEGHPEIINALITAGANVNLANSKGRTPLFLADERGVRVLLEAGADINHQDRNGKTALSFATESGYTEIVNLLKEEISSQKGLRASLYDMRANDEEICKRLARLQTLDLDDKENGDHRLLFHMAKRGFIKALDLLMKYSVPTPWEGAFNVIGDDINRLDQDGHTALYHAVKEGQVEMIQHILKQYQPNLTITGNDYHSLFALAEPSIRLQLIAYKDKPTLLAQASLLLSTGFRKKDGDHPSHPWH